MDSDKEDYVFCGTPIEREEDISSRRKKARAESSGQLRSLPPWKQEVTDEEGRRRFHGAFTGGFSAGFYNTVGSKEGWMPQSFTSSRKSRADIKQQNILNFLDDDEKAEMEGHSLGAHSQFDTFGFTTTEIARKQAEKEQKQRPSAIPGPVPDELVRPATEFIGVKLLLKMGWRHGHSIKDSQSDSLYDARREARRAFLALSSDDAGIKFADSENVKTDIGNDIELPTNCDDIKSSQRIPVYVLSPKQDLHGLGFDPFKHAPEFREKKESRLSVGKKAGYHEAFSKKDNLLAFKSGKSAPGFGIGALEELDDEDDDVYASGYDLRDTFVQEIEEPSRSTIDHKRITGCKDKGVLPGFKVASKSKSQSERFDPPIIPKEFEPRHRFSAPLERGYRVDDPPPPVVPPPDDNSMKVLIDGVTTLVARCGKLFEDLSREKHQSNPLFCFLIGGDGHDYYARKLWEQHQKHLDNKPRLDGKSFLNTPKLTAENRARILREQPLERSAKHSNPPASSTEAVQLQFNLSDTFTKPASHDELLETAKPFGDDPAKQERFELFLKEKYHGGLRSTDSGRSSNMSETARAREKLDFEAAAEIIARGKWVKDPSTHKSEDILSTAGMQFTPGSATVCALGLFFYILSKGCAFCFLVFSTVFKFLFLCVQALQVDKAEDLATKKPYPKREEFRWQPSPILCKRFDISDPYMGKSLPPPRWRSKMDSFAFTFESTKDMTMKDTLNTNREASPISRPNAQNRNEELTVKEAELGLEVENVERPVDLYKAIFSDDSEGEDDKLSPKQVEGPQKKGGVVNATLNHLIAGDFLESLGKELGLEVPADLPPPVMKNGLQMGTVNPTKRGATDISPLDGKDSYVGAGNQHPEFIEWGRMGTKSGSYEDGSKREGRNERSVLGHRGRQSGVSSSEDEWTRKRHRKSHVGSSSDGETCSDDHWRSKGRRREGHHGEKKGGRRKQSRHHRDRSRDSGRRSHHRDKRDEGKWRD